MRVMLLQEGSHRSNWQGGGNTALQRLEEEDGGSRSGGHHSPEGAGVTRCEAAYACDVRAACLRPIPCHVTCMSSQVATHESKY